MSRREATAAAEVPTGPRPFLRWAGGKDWLTDEIRSHKPPKYGRYFEPFVGGGALFFELQPERAVLSDLNAELIDCYRAIRDNVEMLIPRLADMQTEYHNASAERRAEFYYEVRGEYEHGPCRTIFLNKTGFNGLYRVNIDGQFNVPHGRTASGEPPTICDADNLRACSRALRGVQLYNGSFDEVLSDYALPSRGDFIYSDPPFDGTFTGYTAGGFSEVMQVQLARELREAQERGVYVMASNADTPRIRELYRGFRMIEVKRSGSMNSKTSARGKVGELLILGGGCP